MVGPIVETRCTAGSPPQRDGRTPSNGHVASLPAVVAQRIHPGVQAGTPGQVTVLGPHPRGTAESAKRGIARQHCCLRPHSHSAAYRTAPTVEQRGLHTAPLRHPASAEEPHGRAREDASHRQLIRLQRRVRRRSVNQATIAADVLRMWALVTTGMLYGAVCRAGAVAQMVL